jgi:hypothetical protein
MKGTPSPFPTLLFVLVPLDLYEYEVEWFCTSHFFTEIWEHGIANDYILWLITWKWQSYFVLTENMRMPMNTASCLGIKTEQMSKSMNFDLYKFWAHVLVAGMLFLYFEHMSRGHLF